MIRKIKVFLVEDEVIIRSGVKKSINWEQEGYEFVGEASDGELAYPMILKEKPDILITDIRMPFMDVSYTHLLNETKISLGTLDTVHCLLHPTFQLAVRDEIIRNYLIFLAII